MEPSKTPISKKSQIYTQLGNPIFHPRIYRSVFDNLQYLSFTRLNIAFVVNKVCQFMSNPYENHWIDVKKILRYLVVTKNHVISIKSIKDFNIQVFSNSDWVGHKLDSKSQ